jgi:gliding motility-associated-like protein
MKKLLFSLVLTICSLLFAPCSIQAQTGCALLCNSDFENQAAGFINENNMPCWNTTASDGLIEVWNTGTVPAYSGTKFVELNANMVSTLFQNFSAAPGSTVSISFAHRGRAGTDVLSVQIGPVGGPYVNLGNFSAPNTAWIYNTITYTFPAGGPGSYSLRFASVSAAGGATVGNFLDAITINLPQPNVTFTTQQPTCPTAPNGSITANVSGGTAPYQYLWNNTSNSVQNNNLLPGNYSLIITDFYGCQTTGAVSLQALDQPSVQTITQTACDSYSWDVNGITYTQSGNYEQAGTTVYGCDSTIILQLTINNSQTISESVTSCSSYTWSTNGQTYESSGTYTEILQGVSGCDSIRILELSVSQPIQVIETVSSCDTYTWSVNGQTYNLSGFYSETFQTLSGCDSIVSLELTLENSVVTTQNVVACGSYTWEANNENYSVSGNYTAVMQGQSGCDSTVILNLTILSGTASETNISACESYTWNGQTYAQSGTYTYQTINSQGCDSIAVLNLSIFNSVETQEVIWVCEEFEIGTEILSLTTVHGCDSIHAILYQLVPLSERPVVSFSTSPNPVMLPPGIIQTVNTSQNSSTYLWNFGDGSGTTTETNPIHTYQNEGLYEITLIANNATNCPDTAQLQIIVQEDLLMYVPNAFTPDGDAFNNVFFPPISGDFDPYNYELLIFNRWGELIFESRNVEMGWDGTYDGKLAQDGVYTWKISVKSKLRDEPKEFWGSVHLIR